MQGYINRFIEDKILERLKNNPAVAILGPRQCGKSTLAKNIISKFKNSIYLDLERPSDLENLNINEAWIISPINDTYPIKKNVFVSSLFNFIDRFK